MPEKNRNHDADAVYAAMKLLRSADDEALIGAAERHGMDLGAVARMAAGLHDALDGQPSAPVKAD